MAGRDAADRWCHAAQEGLILILVAVAPWAFAAVEPQYHAALLGGVAVFTLLSGVRAALSRGPLWRTCPITLILAGLFLVTALQLVPLPPPVLRIVSPQSAAFYRDLLPSEPEMLAGDPTPLAAPVDGWRPISVYPFATRSLLVDLLALFVVAAAVRQQLANPASLRRLAWVALANGSALSVFALAQSLAAPKTMVYWSIPTKGTVFGPFINRDHFPFYVSLCIGLSTTLLTHPADQRGRRPQEFGAGSILQDSRQLWVVCGIGLMAAACFFSMSRGAVLAMAGSTLLVGALAWGTRAGSSTRPAAIALALGVALLIALWLGTVPVESRLATLGEKEQLWEGRLAMWRATLPHLRDFPLLGSGGGTFEFVEPMYDDRPRSEQLVISQYAHNEYLEAAFEGGVVRLGLTLALAIAPAWLAWRRLHSRDSGLSRGAILGLLWGLLAVALHSAVEFGIHMPAVALLAVVTAAHFSATIFDARPKPAGKPSFARWAVAALAVPAALLLAWEAATWALAEQYHVVAVAMGKQLRQEDRVAALPYWEAALRLRPHDAVMQQAAGQAYLDLYREGRGEFLDPAVRHLVKARDLCPVLAHPHARLGELAPLLARADTPVHYFERAARLLPSENDVWYGLGGAYLGAGRPDDAKAAWRRYLYGNDRLQAKVFDRAAAAWGIDGVRDLLPDRPEAWFAAAERLFPAKEQTKERRPFLEGALGAMEHQPPTPELRYRIAGLQRDLGHDDDATASYRAALREAPARTEWRFEFAQFLIKREKFADARTELRTILERSPSHEEAKDLLAVVEREIQLRGR
jgi:O-antigen ligase/tetratricopeptide (TPR) repeat protein